MEYVLRINPKVKDNEEELNNINALLVSSFANNKRLELYVREGLFQVEDLLESSDSLNFEESIFTQGVLSAEPALNGKKLTIF